MVDSLLNTGCEVCGCSTCPPGYRVTNDAGVVAFENLFEPMTCRAFEQQGMEGLLSLEICNDQVRLDPVFRRACGCPQPPSLLYQTSAAPVSNNTARTPSLSPAGLTQQPAESNNPFLLFRKYPIRSGGIILGALFMAGLYLAVQLRRRGGDDTITTNKPKNRTSVESDAAGDETDDIDDIDVDEALADEEESRAVSKKMVYILNDNDSVSEFGSVFSYNIQL